MFNPALYVRKGPSGELELPLFARIMWLNSERPGWRITSEKFAVLAVEVPEGKSTSVRYIATGHVSVVDEQGRKVLSVPASTEVDSPFFAEDLFRAGAELALDILGFHVKNIPAACWEKVTVPKLAVKSKREPEPTFDDVSTDSAVSTDVPTSNETLDLLMEVLKKNPALLGFSKNELSDSPEMLLNKYCYKITGLPWSMAREEEKRMVRECLEKLL